MTNKELKTKVIDKIIKIPEEEWDVNYINYDNAIFCEKHNVTIRPSNIIVIGKDQIIVFGGDARTAKLHKKISNKCLEIIRQQKEDKENKALEDFLKTF